MISPPQRPTTSIQLLTALTLAVVTACSGDDTSSATDDTTATATTAGTTATATTVGTTAGTAGESDTATTTAGTDSDSATDATTSTTATTAATDSATDATTTATGSTTEMVSTSDTDATTTDATTGDPPPACGDGSVDDGEECDDGNQVDNDKCSNACTKVPCDQQEGGGGGELLSFIWIANSSQNTVSPPYGGAVNAKGDFFASGLGSDPAVKVDALTFQVTNLGNPPGGCKYGMTLDENGDLWAAGYCNNAVFHYSAQNNQWTQVSGSGGNWVLGVMADGDGSVWGAGVQPCRLVRVDVASKTFVNNNIALPGCSEPWGVSIDFEGNVWVVDKANKAFKVDSDTYQVLSVVEGLVGPYTYSDMTGIALKNAIMPQ
jgi:cysteine-rich repeat protein